MESSRHLEKYISHTELAKLYDMLEADLSEDIKSEDKETRDKKLNELIFDLLNSFTLPLREVISEGKRSAFASFKAIKVDDLFDSITSDVKILILGHQILKIFNFSLKFFHIQKNVLAGSSHTEFKRTRVHLPKEVMEDPSEKNLRIYEKQVLEAFSKINELKISTEINNRLVYTEISDQDIEKPVEEDIKLNELRKNPLISNCTLILKNGATFRVDKVTLASRLSYFNTLFTSKSCEERDAPHSLHLDINVDTAVFEKFLEFLYTKSIQFSDNILEVIELGSLAKITSCNELQMLCSRQLPLLLTKETFLVAACYAHQVDDVVCKERCILFLKTHPKWLDRNKKRFSEYDMKELLYMLSVAQYIGSEAFELLVSGEIEKKISYDNFIDLCHKAEQCRRIRKICKNFVRMKPRFIEEASDDLVLAYIKMTTGLEIRSITR